jgi:hypothetical protein
MCTTIRLAALAGLFAIAALLTGCACPACPDDDTAAAVCTPPAGSCSTTMATLD